MRPISVYYWLTPLFWIFDEFLGANIRTAALAGHPFWKAFYYVFCIGIAIVGTVFPDWMNRLGLLEAQLNIVLLVVGVFVPIYGFIDATAMGTMPTESPLTIEMMVNFILASAIWVIAFELRKRR